MEIRNSPKGYVASTLVPCFTKPCHICHTSIESYKLEKPTWTRVNRVVARLPRSGRLPSPYLTLRPFPQSFDVLLVLDHDQTAHKDGEKNEPASWANQAGDERE